MYKQAEASDMDFEEHKDGDKKAKDENYQVSVMYNQYYVRKKEISKDVLMIAICDMERDHPNSENSTFNLGYLDIIFNDFSNNFKEIESIVEEISNKLMDGGE